MTRKIFALAACATLGLWAAQAQAQTPAPAAAAPTVPPPSPVQAAVQAAEAAATPIPGICVFSQDRVMAASLVGKFVQQRLNQLESQSNDELNQIEAKIQADAKELQGKAATMSKDDLAKAEQQLNARQAQLQQLAQVREQEMQATAQRAYDQVGQNLDPLLVDMYTAHKCSLLVDGRMAVITANGMDLTNDAVSRLDGKIQHIQFDRVTAQGDGPGQAMAALGGGAAPAVAAPATTTAKPAAKAPARSTTRK